ncbi:hypothetical protein SEA_KILLIGREW_40 [Mycobacterium phage Killigrew]|nr:hypothetical protein SEA_KILLIGREW_40 [Mycobacterium phage Killigrew]
MTPRERYPFSPMHEAVKPRCFECNRVVHVGAATNNKWLCEYCQIIADFDHIRSSN